MPTSPIPIAIDIEIGRNEMNAATEKQHHSIKHDRCYDSKEAVLFPLKLTSCGF